MILRKLIFTKNRCYWRNIEKTDSRYERAQNREKFQIMVHSTAVNNPYLCRYIGPDDGVVGPNKYNNHWNEPNISKCVNAIIGKAWDEQVMVYQTMPWTWPTWHCGNAANWTHIAFEICEDDCHHRDYFEQTRDAAIELCAMLCRKFDIDPLEPGVLISHAEGYKRGIASNHSDVGHWWDNFGYTMDDFRKDVKAQIKKEEEEVTKAEVEKMISAAIKEHDKMIRSIDDLPASLRPEVQELMDAGCINGGTPEPGDINMPYQDVRTAVIAKRYTEHVLKGDGKDA